MSEYIDKRTIESPTFPQPSVSYKDTNDNIEFNPLTVEACVYGNTFTENNIEIYYYNEPNWESLETKYGSPMNMESPIYAKTDYKWSKGNDPDKFEKYGNFTCRFSSYDGKRVVVTKARMENYPLSMDEN